MTAVGFAVNVGAQAVSGQDINLRDAISAGLAAGATSAAIAANPALPANGAAL